MPAELQPTAEGDLGRTPFVHLLVYAVDRRLTGALFLTEPSGVEHVVRFARGAPVKVKPGDKYALLGELLVEANAITQRVLEDALATKGLLGDVLLLAGCVDRDTLENMAEEQFVRRIVRLASLPQETTFRYYDGHYELLDYGGEPANVDPLHLIWAAVSAHGEKSAMFEGTLEVLGDTPVKLDVRADPPRFGFGADEMLFIDHLQHNPSTMKDLCDFGLCGDEGVKKLLYTLLITRSIDIGRGTLPCGAEEPVPPGKRTATLAKLAVRSVAYRLGAAAPDPPGDGERAPPPSRRRIADPPTTVPFAKSSDSERTPQSEETSAPDPATLPMAGAIESRSAAKPASTQRTPVGSLDPEVTVDTISIQPSEAMPTPVQMPSLVAPTIEPAHAGLMIEGVTVESLADAIAHEAQSAHVEIVEPPRTERMTSSGAASPISPAGFMPSKTAPMPQEAPLDPRELFNLASSRFYDKDYLGALDACDRAKRAAPAEPDYAALSVWIRATLPGADVKALLIELDELLAGADDHVRARFYRGMLRRRLSDDAGALRDFKRILEIDPAHEGATREAAILDQRMNGKEPKSGLLARLFRR